MYSIIQLEYNINTYKIRGVYDNLHEAKQIFNVLNNLNLSENVKRKLYLR